MWTGDELVIWSGRQAAAWDPASNEWRDLGATELRAGFFRRAVWTGSEIIDTVAAVAFDPTTGQTRAITPPPRVHERAQVVWTGSEVVFITGEGRYDPATDTWAPMALGELTPLSLDGVWVGDLLIAVDYFGHASTWDPSADTWTPLPHLPLLTGECWVSVHEAAGVVAADYCGVGALWDSASGTWFPFPGPTATGGHSLIPAGEHLYAYGEGGLYRFLPDLDNPWSEVRRISVGLTVDVPAGWTVAPGEVGIAVRLTTAEGDECLLRAFRASGAVHLGRYLAEGSVVQVTPRIGGLPYEGLHLAPGVIDDRHHLLWAPLSNLVLDVGCDTRSAAVALLQHVLWGWQ